MGASPSPVETEAIVTHRRPVVPLAWMLLVALSVAAMLGVTTAPIPVAGTVGEVFGIGPLSQGWSIRQDIRPIRAPELFVAIRARPSHPDAQSPELEVRLERDDVVLWADRLSLTSPHLAEYVAAFPVATNGEDYTLAVRVIEAHGGAVVVQGVNIGETTTSARLSIMGRPEPGFLAMQHFLFQRAPPLPYPESIMSSLRSRGQLPVAGGIAALAVLTLITAVGPLARAYGWRMAAAIAVVWALAWIVWILVALPHLSPTPSGGFQVGVTNGLPPRAIVVVLFFPILASVGSVAVLGRLPGKLDGWRYLAKGIKQAAIVSGRHWRLAPIPCCGAAAVATVFDAIPLATALAIAAVGLSLLSLAEALMRGGRAPEPS